VNRLLQVVAMVAAGIPASGADKATIDTGSLLREMVDLARLTDFPQPAYKTVQFSSYDRRSNLPDGPGWFENSDGFGGEPIPNFERVLKEPDASGVGEYLICDVPGPGAIVRTWSASISGSIRVYLDDARTPLYEGPARDFLPCPYRAFAEQAGLDQAIFDGTFGQFDAGYCPMPFAGRCRIVWVGNLNEIHFYHVQIRCYQDTPQVTTFQPQDLRTHADLIREVARVLADPDAEYRPRSQKEPLPIAAKIPARTEQQVLALSGPQALERLSLRLSAQDRRLALRQTILHVICDGHPWGQVQSPLGDFFGAAPGVNPYHSLPFSVQPDGTMICRFVMPFKRSLRIVIENRSAAAVNVTGEALPMDYEWNDETSMHFRARWRVNHDVVARNGIGEDVPFLVAGGQGVYVGTALFLMNPCAVPTTWGGWWGEGDEKVFVDEDTFPSIFGTGSEDYFNYSWSAPDIFMYPYCGQPRDDGPGNRGFVSNARWHILDPLPFRQRIAFYLELLSHERTPGMSHARIAYHYARPGIKDDHLLIRDEDLRPPLLPPDWEPASRFGARNQVFYNAEELVEEHAPVSFEQDNLWAGGQLMVWRPAGPGGRLTLRVPVLADGTYVINLGLALDARSGKVSVRLDGRAIGLGGDEGAVDLHAPHRVMLRQFGSRKVELSKGEHALTLDYEGGEGESIGIDYVGVQRMH
jgi:hypothetical protein